MIKYIDGYEKLIKDSLIGEKTLIALIGHYDTGPECGVFINKGNENVVVTLEEENLSVITTEVLSISDDLPTLVEELIDNFNMMVLSESEDEDATYYCTNPQCPAYGVVEEPIKNDLGLTVCPCCGEELTEECEEDEVEYDRLLEILYYIFNMFFTSKDIEEIADAVGLTEYELNFINNYN